MIYVPYSIRQLMLSDEYNTSWHPNHAKVAQAVSNYFNAVYPTKDSGELSDTAKDRISQEIILDFEEFLRRQERDYEIDGPHECDVCGSDECGECDICGQELCLCRCGDEEYIYVWDAGEGCDDCGGMDGTIVDGPSDVGCPHPNCVCGVAKIPMSKFIERYGGINKEKQEQLKEIRKERAAYERKYGEGSLDRPTAKNRPDAEGNQNIALRDDGHGHYGADRRNPDGTIRKHEGIDINMKPGDTVYAYARGVVTGIGSSKNDGLVGDIVTIQHDDETVARYFYTNHNLKIRDEVTKGQEIGRLHNMSFRYGKTPSHLHLEIRNQQDKSEQTSISGKNWGQDIDPVEYLRKLGHRL